MKKKQLKAQLLILLLSSLSLAYSASNVPARLEQTIDLPGVQGRFDHMSLDVERSRLFVSALGNNTAEIIDTKQAKRIHSISGLHEPQGVLYVADVNRLYVANGGDGTVNIFEGTSYQLLKSVKLGSDADNLRFNRERKEIYVGYGSGAATKANQCPIIPDRHLMTASERLTATPITDERIPFRTSSSVLC